MGKFFLVVTLVFACGFLFAPGIALSGQQSASSNEVIVYKSRTCRCCGAWIRHLRQKGFRVQAKNAQNMSLIKSQYGIQGPLQSCHTAVIDGYVIEGHVPASDIIRLLSEKPVVAGLTAPGMPEKSPGMQPDGLPPKDYDVLSFDDQGKVRVFQRY